ncbi:phage tail protein [Clostridium sp. HCS.1]|uniref:phage tail protein n=1 Tax=Clostridium sp. HCS.1 TaxID=3238594 RepID=UPI003A100230
MRKIADGRIIIDTEIDSKGAEGGIKSLSGKLGSLAKTGATAITGLVAAASAAVGALATLSIKQYAEYEQLIGGVETLFKESSDTVKKYADNAYKTAGLSANDYMSTITGFTASLLQGLGGDTKKAAEIGNQAVTDMSDNANKMGTAMESIQNAYQGFAKQNYTMLDNLKLGYGGTKEEMQRLLTDASKLSGMEYSIGNFSDIIEAIHVVQTELGITGTTALEASTTIEGSFNSMKSAWTNVLTGMSDDTADFDTLVGNLVDSIGTFGDNILPRVKIAIGGITKLFNGLVQELPSLINNVLPELLNSGIDVIKNLIGGVQAGLPLLINTTIDIVMSLVNGIIEILPMLLEVGLQALITLGQGIAENLPTLIPVIVDLIISMCDMIIENLPLILDVAIDIILALVEGLVTALPTLIQEVPRIINSFSEAIYNALPQILKAGVDIIIMLVKGLIDSIPIIIQNLPQIIMAIVNVFTLMNWASLGENLIKGIGKGITSMVSNIKTIASFTAESVINGIKGIFSAGGNIGKNLISYVANGISSSIGNLLQAAKNVAISALQGIQNIFGWDNAASIGKNLIKGIWAGISNMSGWILNLIGGFAKSVISSIKGFFGIHSPSKIMEQLIGVNLVKGIGVGIDVETPNLEKDIDANMSDLVAKMQGTVDYETKMTTLRVAAHNNALSGGVEDSDSKSSKQVVENHIHVDIEGREVAYALAPHQDVLNEYYEGR